MKKNYAIFVMLLFFSIKSLAQDPCASSVPIDCGTTYTFTASGNGNVNYGDFCGTPNATVGVEQIYELSVTEAGTYEFEVISASGGYVQYAYKAANLGCDNTGWTCINRTNGMGSIGAVNFSAGSSYYILVNAEPSSPITQEFRIKCARVVCNGITDINCDSPILLSQSGYGDPLYADFCGTPNATVGKETIYKFTPGATGTYEFEVTSASGGYIQYAYKPVSLGCDNTGWTCINRTNGPNLIGAVNFSENTSYYIIVNAEPASQVTQEFKIRCARIVCNDIPDISCDSPILFSQSGYGDPLYGDFCGTPNATVGKEKIYKFTPTVTGTYEFEVTDASGGYVQYAYKPAILGCDNTGWTCINRINAASCSINAINFEANTSYFIIANAESIALVTQIFKIHCARVVCNNIPVLECGVPTLFTQIGYGDPQYGDFCGTPNATTGKEQIYMLPASSCEYGISITSASGTYVQYAWKSASLDCSNTGWTCLGRRNSTASPITATIPASPTSATYLIVNAESSACNATTQQFQVNCCPLATSEFNILDEITIVPNPTTGKVFLKNLPTTQSMTYEVYDTLGRICISGKLEDSEAIKIDGQDGIYLLKIKDGTQETTRKIILKK